MKNNLEKNLNDLFKILKSDKPSLNNLDYWLIHFSENDYHKHTEYGGKWLIFSKEKEIDELWLKIKTLQDKGLFGNFSKSSTALGAKETKSYVICIYTYDSRDLDDVYRVRNALKENGFTKPLHYKRDIETIKGVYGGDNEFLLTV